MSRGRSSLRGTIITSFIIVLVSMTSIIGYISYSNWKSSINNIIVKMENDEAKDIVNKVEALINIPMYINDISSNTVRNGLIDMGNQKEREAYFAGVMKANPEEVYSFSYGTENGEYYGARRNAQNEIELMKSDATTKGNSYYFTTNKDLTAGDFVGDFGKFDPRTRDWYKIAKEKGTPIFSPVYKHFVMNDLAISAAYPIYNKDGVLKGVLGTHILLSGINTILKETSEDRESLTYILDKNSGELVANSLGKPNFIKISDKEMKGIKLEEIDNPYIVEAYQSYKGNSKDNFIKKTKDDKLHIKLTEFKKEGLDWMIITAIPESQFTAEIMKSIRIFIFLSIIALLITIMIYMKSTDTILKPIYNLIDATEKFSKGDFLHRARIFRNDEIGKLSSSFNSMAEQMFILINTLEEKVKQRTADLEKSEENIRLLLDSTAEAIYGVDLNGNCTFCNASCIKMLGYKSQDELLGKKMHWLIHHKRLDGTPIPLEKCKVLNAFLKGEGTHVDDEVFWCADGTYFPVEYFSYPQFREGKVIGAVVTFFDISKRKKSEEEILYLSYHDQLTGLYNRRYFEEELKRLDVEENLPLTIVMADMNGLKLVNDSLGHVVGDELLRKVAEVMTKGCRSEDVIARLGGDEFIILMPRTEATEAEQIVKRIKNIALSEKVGSVDLSISFGYETKNNNEENIQDIFKKAEDYMYKNKLFESPSMRGKTINAIITTLNEKNKREKAHSNRVSEICKSMGEALGLPEGDVEELKNVGLLHDIGKIAIDDSILSKGGKLTDEEWEEIRRHPEIGYRILSTVNDMAEMAEYVLAHHERWDGNGYPKGLKGTEIPFQSRIITIADAYDAMTSERTYRNALSEEKVIEELKKNAGIQFDPDLIRVFIDKVLGKSIA